MKKSLTLFALLTVFALTAFSKQVDENIAKKVGRNFLTTRDNSQTLKGETTLQLAYTAKSNARSSNGSFQATTYFYIFNTGTNGFVIIAGDDIVTPVLGYSDESPFDPNNIPQNAAKWLEGYKNQIRFAIDNALLSTEEITSDWQSLKNGSYSSSDARGSGSVDPLMSTKWNQSPYYNAQCPGGSVTGCVATAMAQVMKYWNYPATGSGFYSYNHRNYGTLSANFGSTTYDWGSMPNDVNGSNDAVATLMYQVGVSVEMDYSPEVSNAYMISAWTNTTNCAEYALKTYFGYPNTMQGILRAYYDQTQWINILKTEFEAGRPTIYAGFGTGGGHCFVADGYDNNDYIHFNWGWGGAYDGFFEINALNPGGVGTGGGTGGYNNDHQAIIGMAPPAGNQPDNISLYEYVTPSSDPIYYGNPFTITTNLVNFAGNDFSGDFTAAIFDDDNNFIDYVEIKEGYSLSGGNHYLDNLVFSTPGIFGMLPGTYTVGIYYRPTGENWFLVENNGNYSNFAPITVINPNDIELYSGMTVTPGTTLTQESPASVNLNIVNYGTSTFIGQYTVGLYNLDGSYVETIGTVDENNGLPSGYIYLDPFLTFSTTSVTANPGTYLLAILHNSNNTDWQLTGSTYYQNPIKVIVIAPSIQPDSYEVNNSVGESYNLPVSFTGDNAIIMTSGSNYHNTSDDDFYKVDLPPGYDYTLTPRIHDSYNSGDGNIYTLDGLFSYTTDGSTWSEGYDDILTGNIILNDGGTIYYHVAPYFAGETGTYLLEMGITRTLNTAVEESETTNFIKLYPNPANQFINVSFLETDLKPQTINLYNLNGQLVFSNNAPNSQDNLILTKDLPTGLYLINVTTEAGVWNNKFNISH